MAVASLIAVGVTTFYGLAYARIYEAVGLTPEEAGFAPAQVLTHAAVGGLALLLLVCLMTFCTFLPLYSVRDDPGVSKERGSWPLLAVNGVFTLVGIIAMALAGALVGLLKPCLFLSGIAILLFLAFSFRRPRNRGFRYVEPRPLQIDPRRYLVVLMGVALPMGLLLTGLITFTQAGFLGQRIENGEAIWGTEFAGVPFLGVRAIPAFVSWNDHEPVGAEMPRCVLYLGGASGQSVLYDHRLHTAYRVPSSEITLQLRPEMSDCNGPVNTRRPFVRRKVDGTLVCSRGSWESYLHPKFRIEWLADGLTLPASTDQRFGREIDPRVLDAYNARSVHCRVTASTAEGREAANSDAAILTTDGRPLPSPSA